MNRLKMVYAFSAIIFIALSCSKVTSQSSLEKHEKLAAKLVNQCANLQENDFVWITGSVRDADLMDEIALQSNKIGAYPIIILQSQKRNRRYFDVVPEKYDARKPDLYMKLAGFMHASISISVGESIGLFKDVPSERLASVSEASNVFNEIFEEKNIRSVSLGNGLYPTEALAKRYGISKAQLSELFWKGVNVDYMKLQKRGNAIRDNLVSGKKLHLTSEAGTDIILEIAARPVFVSDGIISDEEMKKGFPECQVWLPAGEVYLTPVPGSAEGTVILDEFLYQDDIIKQLTLKFKAGKLVSMNAKSGLEIYKDRYAAAGEGKDEFSYIDIGTNSEIKIIPGSKMVAWMASGMVSVGIGNNAWAGGENNSAYASTYHLTKATLKIDGKVIVEKGVLKK